MLALVTAAVGLRRQLWEQDVFTADDGGRWRMEDGNLLVCERSPKFLIALDDGNGAGAPACRDCAGDCCAVGNGRLAAAGQFCLGAAGLDSRLEDLIKDR
jgi:hypothetical protein